MFSDFLHPEINYKPVRGGNVNIGQMIQKDSKGFILLIE